MVALRIRDIVFQKIPSFFKKQKFVHKYELQIYSLFY
jgi:hypothetical protein